MSSFQEMIDTTDSMLYNTTSPKSIYDDDRQKCITLHKTYLSKLEKVLKMQLHELERLLICTTYQISQETEPLVRAGRMTPLIVIGYEKQNAEAMLQNTTCKLGYVKEQKKNILLQYEGAQNERRRLQGAYLLALKNLESQNQTM